MAVASVKQHLSALRMLGDFLVVRQVLPTNPADPVRSPRHVGTVGKTPALEAVDVRALFQSIDQSPTVSMGGWLVEDCLEGGRQALTPPSSPW